MCFLLHSLMHFYIAKLHFFTMDYYPKFLSFFNVCIIIVVAVAYICRTHNLICCNDFLDTMSTPSYNTCYCKHRCKLLFRNIKHTVNQTTVKVYVGTNTLVNLSFLCNNLRSQSFNHTIQVKIFSSALFSS